MKTVVYTCITGGYDTLKPVPQNQTGQVDFICFSDTLPKDNNGWEIRPIPQDLNGLPANKIQRIIKICPHRYLKDYDISLWVDGNIRITCNVNDFISKYDLDEYTFYTRKHPTRKCIYKEAKAVVHLKKASPQLVEKQIGKYRSDGMPENLGMVETCIILRRHNDAKCMLLDNMWAKELMLWTHRDQLSFNYSLWKSGIDIGFLDIPDLLKSKEFRWSSHG